MLYRRPNLERNGWGSPGGPPSSSGPGQMRSAVAEFLQSAGGPAGIVANTSGVTSESSTGPSSCVGHLRVMSADRRR